MAPEQFETRKKHNPYKADIYSLGVLLFRLVFKSFPFKFKSESKGASNNNKRVQHEELTRSLIQRVIEENKT